MASSLINVSKLSELVSDGDRNHYSYTRMKNIMSGVQSNISKKEVQKIRQVLRNEFEAVDSDLAKLEKRAY